MESRDGHCARLQEKVTKDAQHIKSLGSIIDKLRVDIGGLQKTIDTVKNTQVGQDSRAIETKTPSSSSSSTTSGESEVGV